MRSRLSARIGVAFVVLALAVVLPGCTTRTAGMQSPLAHDYDGVVWLPLHTAVEQDLIVAPAYTALVENDPATTSDDIHERIMRLPDDVRGAELVELRVAVRSVDELGVDQEAIIGVWLAGEAAQGTSVVVEGRIADFRRDGDWIVIDDFVDLPAGDALTIRLLPGGSVDPTWEYALTPGRAPYGGAAGRLVPVDAQWTSLDGAVGYQTVFAQRTDTGSVLAEAGRSIIEGFANDRLLQLIYGAALIGIVTVVVATLTRRNGVEQHGR